MMDGGVLIVPATSGASGLVTFIGAIAALELTSPPTVMVTPHSDLAHAIDGRLETVPAGAAAAELSAALGRIKTSFARVETHGPRALLAARRAGVQRRRLTHVFHEPPGFRGARGAAELALCVGLDLAANSPRLARRIGGLMLRDVDVLPPVVLPPVDVLERREARHILGFDGAAADLLVGVVGRLHPAKRPELALEAAAVINARRRTRMHVVFVGDGPARPALEALAGTLGVTASFTGHVADAVRLMRGFDAALGTCPSEAFGLALLEAALVGIPVAAVRSAGTVMTTRDGTLAPLSSAGGLALASALQEALDGPSQDELRRDVLARFGADALRETYERRYEAPAVMPSRSAAGPRATAR
jgi:glycosyltransferase involved in cell wall biosynthesis